MSSEVSFEDLALIVQIVPTKILFAIVMTLDPDSRKTANSPTDELNLQMLYTLASQEFALRQIEPFWRKAKRFALRNAANITKIGRIAACLGLGVLLGMSIDDLLKSK
jgi:hypothetical protein